MKNQNIPNKDFENKSSQQTPSRESSSRFEKGAEVNKNNSSQSKSDLNKTSSRTGLR
ncbi:hypothetical protein [Bdellovibrio bacteriovorus]|uniref:hypothetical protein n=1 Tax=Bdellovibrio bacteriovorus TaxID=959 RepID=UPI000A5C2DEE|nr:hypothetical protein [Bdellovibrio bacteriovorus]